MLSLKKLLSNHFIFLRKVVISSMTIFLLLFGVMPVKVNKVYADENVKINPFIWLMSYFGVNIYTDAVQINEAFDTAIRLAYNTYLASLQPQQQVSIDEIIGSIEWTPSQPNVLRVTGTVFNALKGFANWIKSRSINENEVIIGDYVTVNAGTYFEYNANDCIMLGYFSYFSGGNYTYVRSIINQSVRSVILKYGNSLVEYNITLTNGKFNNSSNSSQACGNPTSNLFSNTYDNVRFYYSNNTISLSTDLYDFIITNSDIPVIEMEGDKPSDSVSSRLAYRYTYGDLIGESAVSLNDIFALPDQAVLDDLIGAADPDQDVEIDLTGSDLPYNTAATLEDILSAINNLVDSYVQDNSYAETIGKIIAQGIAIDDELVDITYPEALTWEVPDLISIPAVYPIIYPDCPDLSACLISGVQEVSNTMNGIINAHPDTGNYVTAALYMGLVLLILGSTVL